MQEALRNANLRGVRNFVSHFNDEEMEVVVQVIPARILENELDRRIRKLRYTSQAISELMKVLSDEIYN